MPDHDYPTLVQALRDCERNTRYLEEFALEGSEVALRNQALAAQITHALEHELDPERIHALMSAAATLYEDVTAATEAHGAAQFDAVARDAEELLAAGALPVHVADQVRALIAERTEIEGPTWMVYADRLRSMVDTDTLREQ